MNLAGTVVRLRAGTAVRLRAGTVVRLRAGTSVRLRAGPQRIPDKDKNMFLFLNARPTTRSTLLLLRWTTVGSGQRDKADGE
jgi:uncharacterized cupin superfamily protein